MILINWIKKRQSKKRLEKEILKHKRKILKVFFKYLQTPQGEKLKNNTKILKEIWYNLLDYGDDIYEKENFELFRKYYFPINKQERKEALIALTSNNIIQTYNWENYQNCWIYLNNELRKKDFYEEEK